MMGNSEHHLAFFVMACIERLYTTDVTFSVLCELSQSIGKTEFSSTAKIEQTLTGKKNTASSHCLSHNYCLQ